MYSTFNEAISVPSPCIMGVFGITKITEKDLHSHICTPILSELERIPDKMLLPSEGNSSIYLQSWAESLGIKTQIFQSDWARNGRVAQRIRDERIQKECTHALVFLSNRSDRLEKYAETLARKGKIVFTSSPNHELQMLSCSEPVVPSAKASTRARKSSKGTVQTLLKFQTTK